MIHAKPGNLVAVSANDRYYYALILRSLMPRIRGHWCFVFHKTSEYLLSATEILNEAPAGFYEFVDFIWAKRENRLVRVAEKVDVRSYDQIKYSRSSLFECINDTVLVERVSQNHLPEIGERVQTSARKFIRSGASRGF
jgi:hypothetical protein